MNADIQREFRRRMARFEIGQARRKRADGRPDRAAVALRRAIAAATIPHRPEEADLLSLRACIGA